ncbi:MAG TPA: hypothetical protein VKY90_19460 [Candidatus Dormibacteraeota bacterium]|nr:hypothetical protein [Candidatus Dormibacteraeota bacterium]
MERVASGSGANWEWTPERSWMRPAEPDELSHGALWDPDRPNRFGPARLMLDGAWLAAAMGVVGTWSSSPEDATAAHNETRAARPDRFLLGLGGSCLGHLRGDRSRLLTWMPERSRDRSAGARPCLTTPEHTRQARTALGPGKPLLAPEQAIVPEIDPTKAHAFGRQHLHTHLQAPTPLNSRCWLGFTEDDVADSRSDQVVDTLAARGGKDRIRERTAKHHAADADHARSQIAAEGNGPPREKWRTLAHEVGLA